MRRPERTRPPRVLLALACVAVLVSAADTYVVVLALPDMMLSSGLDTTELHRAAPIVSLFLLGYVVALPIAGRLSDLYGRRRVLTGSLLVLAAGSLMTAAAGSLEAVVAGRLVQGIGGGGLIPAALALVADGWPVDRRGPPLGVLGAVQELGSLVGPLFGAAVLALADWRMIFWITLAVALMITGLLAVMPDRATMGGGPGVSTPHVADGGGGTAVHPSARALLALAATLGLLAMLRPDRLVTHAMFGEAFVPLAPDLAPTQPLLLLALAALTAAAVIRQRTGGLPALGRAASAMAHEVDLASGLLVGMALGSVVLAFGTADPAVSVVSDRAPWQLGVGAVAGAAAVWRARNTRAPLVPHGALSTWPARGALLVSLLIGAALIAPVVGIPVYVRTVLPGSSQLDAGLQLLRLLSGIPAGALAGGLLVRRSSPRLVAGFGLAVAAGTLWVISGWSETATAGLSDDATLIVMGIGFGLPIAPVAAALLASAPTQAHGVLSALLVVARMCGMLVGLSALTAIGLRRFADLASVLPGPDVLCPGSPLRCEAHLAGLRDAALAQVQATFLGGAVCAAVAAVFVIGLLGGPYAAPQPAGPVASSEGLR